MHKANLPHRIGVDSDTNDCVAIPARHHFCHVDNAKVALHPWNSPAALSSGGIAVVVKTLFQL
jgi:hypothetical protein